MKVIFVILLEGKGITYKIGNRKLLNNIAIQVKQNECWAILGLNGCGKTTLTGVLSGYLPCEENCIYRTVPSGLVSESFFSKYYRNEKMEDVILSGFFQGVGYRGPLKYTQIKRANTLMKMFDIDRQARKPYCLLSKGERQKGLIVRALLNQPKLLFLDEPYSGLDILGQSLLQEILDELIAGYGISVIMVTHSINEISDKFNKAMLIKAGEIFLSGNFPDVVNSDNMTRFLDQCVKIIRTKEGVSMKIDADKSKNGLLLSEMFA